jgi:predicted acetyltransferase
LQVNIISVTEANRSVLENLYQFYLYEFTNIVNFDVAADGRYPDGLFNHNFIGSNHSPFLVKVDEQWAGFVIAENRTSATLNYTMRVAEFFVMHKYRRHGIGRYLAVTLFNRFPGRWKVAALSNNLRAIDFWRTVIAEYTTGNYEEVTTETNAVIQYFDNRPGTDR